MDEQKETLADAFESGGSEAVRAYLELHEVDDIRRELDRLEPEARKSVVSSLTPETAGELLRDLVEAQAVEILEEVDAAEAAPIITSLSEDVSADFLREMGGSESEAILEVIASRAPKEEADLRARVAFDDETAGALMEGRFDAFDQNATVGEVLTDLSENA